MCPVDPSITRANGVLAVNRTLDLAAIRAVGFDLDHTLALYDDDAVNALAMAEACALLAVQRGFRDHELVAAPNAHDAAVARALALDLTTSHVVKLDAGRRVRVARRGGRWLTRHDVDAAHPECLPADGDGIHPISSRFDIPTMWLFDAVARACDPTAGMDAARVCRDVREMLDWSHTRGELKQRLVSDLTRFVSGVSGTTERLAEWRRAGKRLFVVTNSERAFATAVLDLAVGPAWRTLFDVVSTSSRKPSFFMRSDGTHTAERSDRAIVLEGAHAAAVEAAVGVNPEHILYVGDNARADILAARAHGWKTAHVVEELAAAATLHGEWGSAFAADDLPTWFAHQVRHSADVVCDRVDRLLACDPDQTLATGESA